MVAIAALSGFSEPLVQKKLNSQEALKLAVKISNEKCKQEFDVAPFDSSSYEIEYINGFWMWGSINERGINGYSVVTKFDKYGKNDSVNVFFSIDDNW